MRVLVTGASGQLGAYLLGRLLEDGYEPIAWSGRTVGARSGLSLHPLDFADRGRLERALEQAGPGAIVHLAAIARADEALRDPDHARRVNVEATSVLAAWCERRSRRFLYISTDLVFDGENAPYAEGAAPRPLMLYGRTKLEGERRVGPSGLVVRLPLMYGPSRTGTPSVFDQTISSLRDGRPRSFFRDEFRTPLDYGTAAEALALLLASDATGTLHVGGPERVSRSDLMRRIASVLGLDEDLVRGNSQRDVVFPEPRPVDVSLRSSRLSSLLPDLVRPTIESTVAQWANRA